MDADSLWKVLAIALYGAVLVAIGVAASRRMVSIRDYFAADKKLGFWSAAFSARATGESAWLLLGLTGIGFAVGAQGFWIVLGEVLGVAVAWLFMAGRFKRLSDRYGALTVPDYLEARFRDTGHGLRLVGIDYPAGRDSRAQRFSPLDRQRLAPKPQFRKSRRPRLLCL